MSTAVITPIASGGAVFELNGMTHWFPSRADAVDEAVARSMPYEVRRLPVGGRVQVVTTSPANADS